MSNGTVGYIQDSGHVQVEPFVHSPGMIHYRVPRPTLSQARSSRADGEAANLHKATGPSMDGMATTSLTWAYEVVEYKFH